MKNHGTPTQLGIVVGAFITALCTAVMDFSIIDLIKSIDKKGEKITQHLRLVLNAIMTGQDLALIDAKKDSKSDLLELVSTVNIAGTNKFITSDHFKLGETEGVKIGFLGDSFKKHFLKKEEENIEAATVKSFKFTRHSLDSPIIASLGDDHETYLAYVWELMKAQSKGESGTLFTTGRANIFYISDINNILWEVYVYWYGGWRVDDSFVDSPRGWGDGDQVFARSK